MALSKFKFTIRLFSGLHGVKDAVKLLCRMGCDVLKIELL